MDNYNIINKLAKSRLFNGIDIKDLERLINCLNPMIKEYSKNEYIAITGNKLTGLGVVISGEGAIYKENALGNSTIVSMIEPGDIFGEALVFSNMKTWNVNIMAHEPCKILFLSSSKIINECHNVCEWHRQLIFNMLGILSEKALILNRKVDYLTITGIREKLCTFLLEQYKQQGKLTFMLPMNRKELAEFLNVSRPSLSREMCRLRDEGAIDFHMSSIKIKSPEILRSSC